MSINELYNIFLQCNSISTDTRKIIPGSIFFALKGQNFDANTFALEAIANGAKYAVIDNPKYKKEDHILLVDDTLKTLQQLAAYHRELLGLPIIALTGSNGKTTTKELINSILSQKYNVKATIGNLNNHIGVPLTLLSFTHDIEIGIVEMGANHQNEIEMLCQIAKPNFGYVTNFGKAHLEGFGGVEGVIKGKSELYEYLKANIKTVFVNLDDPIQEDKTKEISRYTFAVDSYNCDVKIETVKATPMVTIKYKDIVIHSNLIGLYNANNINAAITIGHFFKVEDNKIKDAIESYIPNNNRSQFFEKNNNKIILDAYNANPSSMNAALENFRVMKGEKIAILGDMFELGTESLYEHYKIVESLQKDENIKIYFVGNDFYRNKNGVSHFNFFEDYETFKTNFRNEILVNKTILVKGSRGMALERILDFI